jgi:hypothetical protein
MPSTTRSPLRSLANSIRRFLSALSDAPAKPLSPLFDPLEPRLALAAAPIQLHIANNTGAAGLASNELYVFMYGLVVGRGNVPFVISPNGNASIGSTAKNGNAPSIKLSDIKNTNILIDSALSIEGGRLYISNSPSTITINGGAINGPSTSTSKTYFDFVEFALNAPGSSHQLVIDTSQVDAVGYPITLTVAPPDPSFSSSGISINREALFSQFRAQVPNAKDYIFSSGEDFRILSPGQAISQVLSAQTLSSNITAPQKTGSIYTATVTVTNTGLLKAGMIVAGPHLPNHVTIDRIVNGTTVVLKSDMGPFTAKSGIYLNYYTAPVSSLVHYFDKAIDDFFRYYTQANPLVLSSVANVVYKGFTTKVTRQSINGTNADYAVLRMISQDGKNKAYDIYYPFFSTNTPSGKTPAANGLTPINTAPPPPPSFWAYSPTPKPQLTMYEPPSQMAFAGNGIFADDAFQFTQGSPDAQVLGNLENQIVVALNRGYATAFNTRKGTVSGTNPLSNQATVHLTSGTTDGIVPGMYFSTFPIGEMMTVKSVNKAANTITVQALASGPQAVIRPIGESVMHFTTFFPTGVASNAYAKFLHSPGIAIGQRAYALSYDDQGGYSTTLTSNYGSTPSKVAINLVSWSAPHATLNDAPTVGALFSHQSNYLTSDSVTLSTYDVADPDSNIASVSFYTDNNADGLIDAGDALLGTGTQSGSTWSLTLPASKFSIGENRVLSQAKDVEGDTSPPVSASFDVLRTATPSSLGQTISYTDAQGNKVKATLTGPGTLKAHFGQPDGANADAALIQVTGSVAGKSSLVFTVLRDASLPESTGITTIGEITVDGGLAVLSGAKVNLTSGLQVSAAVASITLNDFLAGHQQTITLGGSKNNQTAFYLGRLKDISIHTTASISTFRAVEWRDDNGAPDALSAVALGSLVITGRAATKAAPAIQGDFQADLTLSGVGTSPKLNTLAAASIAGQFQAGTWTITGNAGPITAHSFTDATFQISGDLIRLTSPGQAQNTQLNVGGLIGVVSTVNWLTGSITADKITGLATRGLPASPSAPAIPGDFSGSLTLTAQNLLPHQYTINSANIAGTLHDASWNIAGNAGLISVGAISNSSLFVGVKPSVNSDSLPTSRSQFTRPTARLLSFTVTGRALANPNTQPSFTNSRIAAGILTQISLKRVDLDAPTPNGLVAATQIAFYQRQTTPTPSHVLRIANKSAPAIYDPLSAATVYSLQIVP